MISSIYSKINSTKKRGRARKLTAEQEQLVKQIVLDHARDGGATVSDAHIAARLSEVEQIHVSAQFVLRLRRELGIAAVQRGGARPGAGRPRGTRQKAYRTYRTLRIDGLTLVRWCKSAYDVENAQFCYDSHTRGYRYYVTTRGGKRKHVNYIQKFVPNDFAARAAGLRTVYLRPLPVRLSNAQRAQAHDALRRGSK